MKLLYFDHNATTPTDKRVLDAMLPYFNEKFANPSSIYGFAQRAHKSIDEAREKVAKLLNAKPEEIIFTSGGTESNNLAIKGVAYANKKKDNHIITSTIEHPAVLNTCKWLEEQGYEVTYVSVDRYGIIDLNELKDAVFDRTILITVMHANNEIGTIEPSRDIAKIAKENGIYFHTDAVQSVGKLSTNVAELGVDLLSLSGHKLYGPKGMGALYLKKGTKIEPLVHGGHHEMNRRAGTENVPGIIGLGKACEIAASEMESEVKGLKRLRDKLSRGLTDRIDDVIVNGHPEHRLAGTLNISFKYVEGESILLSLDNEGIAVSTGSACATGSLEPSHVLTAIGLPPEVAQSSIRFSLGRDNTEEEVDKVLAVLPPIVKKLRAMSPLKGGGKGSS